MKIEPKIIDTSQCLSRNSSDIKYIVIQEFKNGTPSHYQIANGKVYQMIPDKKTSDAINGPKISSKGKFHGICTKYNCISISIDKAPSKEDTEIINHLIMTIRQRYKINLSNVLRQTDVTGEMSPEIWYDNSRWDRDVISKLNDMR